MGGEQKFDIGNTYCEECRDYHHVTLSYDEDDIEPNLSIEGLHLHLKGSSGETIVMVPAITVFVVTPESLKEIGEVLTPRAVKLANKGHIER